MKKTSLAFSLFMIFGLLTFDSCKKDEPIPEPTKTEILTDGNWIGIRSEAYEENILESTEIITENELQFNTNGSGVMFYKGTIDEEFQWSFNTDKTKLYIDFGNGDIWSVQIDVLTNSIFTFSETYQINQVNYKDIFYFGR